jgi:hypothetical protein
MTPAKIINAGVRAVFHSGLVQIRLSKGLAPIFY